VFSHGCRQLRDRGHIPLAADHDRGHGVALHRDLERPVALVARGRLEHLGSTRQTPSACDAPPQQIRGGSRQSRRPDAEANSNLGHPRRALSSPGEPVGLR
jgi:hypothetical protein